MLLRAPRTGLALNALTGSPGRAFLRALHAGWDRPTTSQQTEERAMKRTYQPHNTRRARTHGFRARMASAGGRKVINARRRKGRARLATTIYQK